MSSTFSAASAASPSASSAPECEPSPSARSIPIAEESSPSTGQMSLFTEISESLPPRRLWPTPKAADAEKGGRGDLLAWCRGYENKHHPPPSTSSAEDFPAPIFPSPVRDSASPDLRAAYGRSTPELLAKFDPATSSWRTSQLCLDGALSEFSETWPRSGLMRSGTAYLLPPLVRLTDETGSGSLPTPSATSYGTNHGGGMGRVGPVRPSLETMARKDLWPTPTLADSRNTRNATANNGSGSTGHSGTTLSDIAWMEANGTKNAGSLNPAWVEWLMGFPLGWTVLEASVMPLSRKSRKSSDAQS